MLAGAYRRHVLEIGDRLRDIYKDAYTRFDFGFFDDYFDALA